MTSDEIGISNRVTNVYHPRVVIYQCSDSAFLADSNPLTPMSLGTTLVP